MSTTTSAPASIRIIERIKRGTSFIFGADHLSITTMDKTESEDKNEDNSVILPYHMGYLTPEMKEEARIKLNETEETKQTVLSELRCLIKKEKNLVCRQDDNFLLQFLRARKFNIKRTFKLLQNYYQFRKEYSDIYDNLDPSDVRQVVLHNFLGFLTKRDRKGSVVFLLKIGMWDPAIDTFEKIFRTITAVLVNAVEDPATQVTGFRVIFDCRQLSWKQVKYCTPQNILLIIRSTQFCFPARYRAIHILSENKLFNIIWSICHPFLTNKLKKRIIHHGNDVIGLRDYIHPSILPVEFGGMDGPFDNSSWEEVMNRDESWMVDLLKYGYK